MADDLIGRTVLELATEQSKLDKGIAAGEQKAKGLQNTFAGVRASISGIFAGIGVAFAARELAEYSDRWLAVSNQLKIVTSSAEELASVQTQLFDIAQRTRSPIDGTVQLYARLSLAAEELGADQSTLMQFTEGVGQALAVTNTSAAQASGSLMQLAQALGSGVVRAEEFNSILEGTPRIARAVAAGLDMTVSQLRNLVLQGKVTSKEFFGAFMNQLPALRVEFSQASMSIGQSLTILNNSLTQFVGKADAAMGAGKGVATSITGLATTIDIYTGPMIGLLNALATAIINTTHIGVTGFFGLAQAVQGLATRDWPLLKDSMDNLKSTWDQTIGLTAATTQAYKDAATAVNDLSAAQAAMPPSGPGDPSIDEAALTRRNAVIAALRQQIVQTAILNELQGSARIAQEATFQVEDQMRKAGIDLRTQEAQSIITTIAALAAESTARDERAGKAKKEIQTESVYHNLRNWWNQERVANLRSTLNTISSMSTAHNTTLAAIGKAAAYSSAVINTYKAAQVAMASAPPPFSYALAAATIAAGMVNVAKISGTELAGGGRTNPGKPYIVGEVGPELFLPDRSGAVIPNNELSGGNKTIEYHFHATGLDFSSEEAARRFFQIGAAQIRAGIPELLNFSSAMGDQNLLNPGRAYG